MRKRTSSSRRDLTEEEAIELLFPTDSGVPKEALEPLCTAVGAIILLWGAVEASLHLIVVSVFDDAGGKAIEPQFPRELARKLKFLRKCLKRIDVLRPLDRELRLLCKTVADLGTARHGIVHAAVTGFDADTGRIRFTGLDSDRSGHLIKVARHTVLEVNELSLECADLAGRLSEMDSRIREAIAAKNISDNGGRPLGSEHVRRSPVSKKGGGALYEGIKRFIASIRGHVS